jgi:hypothetical protein
VEVGTPAITYYVDENRLVTNSRFFRAALEGTWTEAETRTVKLPHDDPEAFNAYLDWIHRRQVTLFYGIDEKPSDCLPDERILDAYVLGDKLIDIDFKDAVCDLMAINLSTLLYGWRTYSVPAPEFRCALYDRTQTLSKLRQLLVRGLMELDFPGEAIERGDDPDFLFDCVAFAKSFHSGPVVAAVARCAFHEHVRGFQSCYRSKYKAKTRHCTTWYRTRTKESAAS